MLLVNRPYLNSGHAFQRGSVCQDNIQNLLLSNVWVIWLLRLERYGSFKFDTICMERVTPEHSQIIFDQTRCKYPFVQVTRLPTRNKDQSLQPLCNPHPPPPSPSPPLVRSGPYTIIPSIKILRTLQWRDHRSILNIKWNHFVTSDEALEGFIHKRCVVGGIAVVEVIVSTAATG